ncbi:MAG TPA: HD domain-containing phosphohydrolase, partial [Blastocatellia bacterium]|nr:HD domain-containing phosphohydrolase [Blastocatellia bacterium]
LIRAEKDLLEQTLRGAVKVMTDLLSLVNPTAFGRASRMQRLAGQIAQALKVEDAWQIEIAAMLSQIGCITIPEDTLVKVYQGKSLNMEEVKQLQAHPKIGAELISHIPRLEKISEIIAHQEARYQGLTGQVEELCGQKIPLGSRILKVALDFDKLRRAGNGDLEAMDEIKRRQGWYDELVVDALQGVLESERQYETRLLSVNQLTVSMITSQDILSNTGLLLLPKGLELTQSHLVRLYNFVERGLISDPISVMVPVQ